MQNRILKQAEFRTVFFDLFSENFQERDAKRFTLLHEFECTKKLDAPIIPAKFHILKDAVSLKKFLRMSWKNSNGVELKNICINIVASNYTTEWRMENISLDVSSNSEDITAKYGVVLPDAAEKYRVEIESIELANGIVWNKSGEYFGFELGEHKDIFASDQEGNRLHPIKERREGRPGKINKPLTFVSVMALILAVGIFAGSGIGLFSGNKTPGNLPINSTLYSSVLHTLHTTATTKKTVSTTKTTATSPRPVDPEAYKGLYADIDFNGGRIEDKQGNTSFNFYGKNISVATNSVMLEGELYHVPSLQIHSGSFAKGMMEGFSSAAEFEAAVKANGGWTVEAFYVNRSRNSGTTAIICNTQTDRNIMQQQGWGIAETNITGAKYPYFVTGTGTGWATTNTQHSFAADGNELVHVVGVYNSDTKVNRLYINGKLITTVRANDFKLVDMMEGGSLVPSSQRTQLFNVFYIGGDPTTSSGVPCDYPAADLTVVDIKLYFGALSGTEVMNAYKNSVEEIKCSEKSEGTDKIMIDAGYDLNDYNRLELFPTLHGYYNSTSRNTNLINPGYSAIISAENGSTSTSVKYYWATKIFEKGEIPNGSVIVVTNGYQYRPEGWQNLNGRNRNTRPSNVMQSITVVDDVWWSDYNYRAFNITSDQSYKEITISDYNAFAIYIPKNGIPSNPEIPEDTNDAYVDIDFNGGTVTDAKGNADFDIKGYASNISVGSFNVKYGSKEVTVTGINIKAGAWVLGTFNKLHDNVDFDNLVAKNGGFTVEAFYANRTNSSIVAVISATEGNEPTINRLKQGWGIADNRGNPYFITGMGNSWSNTTQVMKTVPVNNLVHVVGVYDDAADQISLYIDGDFIKSAPASTFMSSAAKEKNDGYIIGNTFGLGGEATVSGMLCDYNATDLVIADAKIYMRVLTKDEVINAYKTAVHVFDDDISAPEIPEEPEIPEIPVGVPDAYVDVDFVSGGITDSKDNATFGYIGTPIVERVTVTHNNVEKSVEALHITSQGNFAYGMLYNLDTVDKMNAFLANGFSVEVFYLDNSSSTAGILCMTETPGGWGIAHSTITSKYNKPYFITGTGNMSGIRWNAVYSKAAASDTELVHVVATYDPIAKMHTIYINGEEYSNRENSGQPGTNIPAVVAANAISDRYGIPMFNTFGMGGEFSAVTNLAGDFLADNLIIVDAKIYDKTLTANQARAAYKTATANFK